MARTRRSAPRGWSAPTAPSAGSYAPEPHPPAGRPTCRRLWEYLEEAQSAWGATAEGCRSHLAQGRGEERSMMGTRRGCPTVEVGPDHPGPELGATRDLVARLPAGLRRRRERPRGRRRAGAHRLGSSRTGWTTSSSSGCHGLALGPVFASRDARLRHVDHFRIDPRLGDDADFRRADRRRRARRGLRVLLDGVFNHVGRGFPAFAAALDAGPVAGAPGTPAWFRARRPRRVGRLRDVRGPPPARRARTTTTPRSPTTSPR